MHEMRFFVGNGNPILLCKGEPQASNEKWVNLNI